MKLSIIQFSDIHFKEEENSISLKMDKLVDAIKNEVVNSFDVFLVITGDIAYSGKETEYNEAMKFVDYIMQNINVQLRENIKLVFVPGNHDCNIDKSDSIRPLVISNIIENKNADSKQIELCCLPQKNFFEFSQMYKNGNILFNDKLFLSIAFNNQGYRVLFNCYNTPWISQIKEKRCLFFPVEEYYNRAKHHKADLIISLLHHPFHWHDTECRRKMIKCMENTSDIILTGHEHESTARLVTNLDDDYTTEHIEGSVLQDSYNSETSGFNIINVDIEKNTHRVLRFNWNGEYYTCINRNKEPVLFKRNKNLLRNSFIINDKYLELINDSGANFTHPRKKQLQLEDIYIYPDLRKLNNIDHSDDEYIRVKIKSSEELGVLSEKNNHFLIIGDEKCGKTSLCKVLYKKYHVNNYIPIYINGFDIKDANIEKFNKLVCESFEEQYSMDVFERFLQLDKDKIVLIVDNIHKSRLNIKYLITLVTEISNVYPNILITAGHLLKIEEIVSKEDNIKENKLTSYQQFKIKELGHLLRSRLIEKWYLLGQDYYLTNEELIRQIEEAQRKINIVIGKNYVPSYPIFLLTILQTIEAGNTHDLKQSSYGHYYHLLIMQALKNLKVKNDEIDAYLSFLTELAISMYREETEEISKDDLFSLHKKFCHEDYCISSHFERFINFNTLINELIEVRLLEITSNNYYKFRYNYVYYYSVAKFFADNITYPDTKNKIDKMCDNLYIEEYANIFMFLIHHSNDPFILDIVLKKARSVFSYISPIKFGEDIKTINNLLERVPEIMYEEKDIKVTREQKLMRKDKHESMLAEIDEDMNSEVAATYDEDNEKAEEIMLQLNLAFKMMEILGQILKNHWSKLRGSRRIEIGEETYFIGLRTLNSFFSILDDKSNYFIDEIKRIIEERQIIEKSEIDEIARKFLFNLCNEISYIFVKKVTESIGYEMLSETFKAIIEKNDTISVKIIDISIKLDYFRSFPHDEIKKILNNLTGNKLPLILLRRMAIDYLYMFDVSFRDRQRICQLLGIPIKSQLRIEQISKNKKLMPTPTNRDIE